MESRVAISIKNNFLKKQQFLNIENFIMGNSMPWFFDNNNGYNYFKKDNKKTKPKANTAVFFDPSELHCSSSCSDQKRRVTININYE